MSVVIPLALRGGVLMGLELLPFRCIAMNRITEMNNKREQQITNKTKMKLTI